MTDNNLVSWRTLEKEGCGFGRMSRSRVEAMEKCVEELEKKMDRLTWALVGTAITFGTAAVMLALNLVV